MAVTELSPLDTSTSNEKLYTPEQLRTIANALVEESVKVKPGEKVLLWYDENPGSVLLLHEIKNRCLAKGAEVLLFKRNLDEDAKTFPTLPESGIGEELSQKTYFDKQGELIEKADAIILVRGALNPEALDKLSAEQLKRYNEGYDKANQQPRMNGHKDRWVVFYWPTEYEAEREGLSYPEYFREVMESYNQNWKEIKQAQEFLVGKLNNGKKLTFIAEKKGNTDSKKRTEVTLSIDGMTFDNSTIEKNYPGSEVFSAPVLESVNGQIYAEGEFIYKSGGKMRNIYLRIENGKIVEAHADEGNETLQTILNQDNKEGVVGGSRYFGEVALGTNSGLHHRFFNTLLNEKVSGSFHMAVGKCYTDPVDSSGRPVNVNNGNTADKTSIHWDITIPMWEGGKIILDDEDIQVDGNFIAPELSVLNPRQQKD